MAFASSSLRAQNPTEPRTYTSPPPQWVFLTNTDTSKIEYDKNHIDSRDTKFIKISLRETPHKKNEYEFRRTRMWEQRSIQGYDDSLHLHPHFFYEGYEKYKYTIFQEEIDCEFKRVRILRRIDYNENGEMLTEHPSEAHISRRIGTAASPESIILELLLTGNLSLRSN